MPAATRTPVSGKRTLSFEEHIKIIDALILHHQKGMDSMNKYIEQVRHPSTTYGMVVTARDNTCRALRSLEAARLVLTSYSEAGSDS